MIPCVCVSRLGNSSLLKRFPVLTFLFNTALEAVGILRYDKKVFRRVTKDDQTISAYQERRFLPEVDRFRMRSEGACNQFGTIVKWKAVLYGNRRVAEQPKDERH